MSRCCLEPRWFIGDPTLLARGNIIAFQGKSCEVLVNSAGWRLPCRSGPRVLSLPGQFVGDPASLVRDNILSVLGLAHLNPPSMLCKSKS